MLSFSGILGSNSIYPEELLIRESEKAMSKATKQSRYSKHWLAKILLLAALGLTTLLPVVVSAAADQPAVMEGSATPTPTPEPIKPPAEYMVSWNT